jgi:hypothetical protein
LLAVSGKEASTAYENRPIEANNIDLMGGSRVFILKNSLIVYYSIIYAKIKYQIDIGCFKGALCKYFNKNILLSVAYIQK